MAELTGTAAEPKQSKYLVLAAMLFAVAMLFIDQTIISIASPTIQQELGLSDEGVQWVVNGYLLALSAFFALGGRLSDILGHKRMVLIGVTVFAVSSALCGLTPANSMAEAWIIVFRVVQGLGGALLFPAAIALIVDVFPVSERGKALALFFGITGAFTAIGPIAGGYLTQWSWRAIFWVNIPVALLAIVLTLMIKAPDQRRHESIDWRGAALVASGMALAVLGFQQSSDWGWESPATWGCITAGVVLLVIFVLVELRTDVPLIRVRIFSGRAFAVDNLSLFFVSAAFVPVFFFISLYAQISLGYNASESGLFLMWFFLGFVVAAQIGGRILDTRGVKITLIVGCAVAAAGFVLWARATPKLDAGAITPYIVMTGAGIGLMFGPTNTDAVNRAINASYGEVSGITQTVRYFGASVGMAILGTLMINQVTSRFTNSLVGFGVPDSTATQIAAGAAKGNAQGGGGAGQVSAAVRAEIMKAYQVDFADAVLYVFYGMAVVMVIALIAGLFHPGGRVVAEPAH